MSENITSLLEKSSCYCLNEDASHTHSNLFVGDSTLPLISDCDAELLLHLAFGQTVKITALEIGIPNDESCPRTLKLFCNQNNMGFSEAGDLPPTQVITIAQGQKVARLNLMAVKWQRVESISIFVEDNYGSETTTIHSIKIFGQSVMSTNVADIKKLGHEH